MLCRRCETEFEGPGRCPVCGSGEVIPPNAYYARQFARIDAGQVPAFNVAAMLGGPVHMLYRGCYKRFFTLYFPYLLTVALLLGACALSAAPQWCRWLVTGQAAAPGALLTAAWILLQLSGLWGLGLAIYNGNTFNRALYNRCLGRPYVQGHVLPVLALSAAALALAAALCLGYARLTLQAAPPAYGYRGPEYRVPQPAPDYGEEPGWDGGDGGFVIPIPELSPA